MDSADEDWLEMEEEKGGPLISAQAFVQVMNLLEVTSYRVGGHSLFFVQQSFSEYPRSTARTH